MFRRSRFSIRPNVSTSGRTAATPQEAPPVNQQASETPKDVSESSTAVAVTPSEKPTATADGNDQNGEGTSSSAAVQRRKRFSVKPKVAPGRLSTISRAPKSAVKTVSEIPVEVAGSGLDKPTTTDQTAAPTAAPQGFRSPRRRRPSEESKQPKVKATSHPILSEGSGPSAVPPAEDLLKQTHLPLDNSNQLENTSGSQAKEVPSRLPDKVPSSLPEKEAVEISEKAKTLVSSKSRLSVSPASLSLSRLLNGPSDLQRLAKAQKLRDLIREEMHKVKKIKKAKLQAKEFTLDPAKMTMRDLIHYLPVSNPMTSSLEEPALKNESVVPPSPGREESPEMAQEPEAPPKIASPREEGEEEEEEAAEEEAEEEQEEAVMVPQVKVAEDGSLIIDEESLTVEVQRAKGPNPAEDRDPIFERGSATTYSSFRKPTYSKPWFSEETDMFFLAISMVGTDFSMICQLFPHRVRSEIKNKFKKEERENSWRIDKAFRERRKLDIEYFSKLLEKILEVQKNRKKLKSIAEKSSPKKHKRKTKGKKAARKNEMTDSEEGEEEEGEKENEDLCNEEETPVSKSNKKRKRQNKEDASKEEPDEKKNKMGQKSSQQDEACKPEDAEAALPEDDANSDVSENTENADAAKETVIQPANLSRGRAPKPLLPLEKKWGKNPSLPSSEAKDVASDEGGDSVSDGASKEQVNKDASPAREVNERKSASDDISSEDEDATVQPPKPTRYGRMPKPTKPLTYPAKDDTRSSASETTPASAAAGSTASDTQPKPKCTTKRRGSSKTQSECKKPKLVTLRASQSEDSDEENEEEEVEEEQLACSSSRDGIAPAFVPASLRSPHPVIPEVEETMEELDFLVNMPEVLGISQDALCPDVSCKLAQNETGTAEPCEHQKELQVDVLDLLSSENTEVTDDDRYNEAAQTLLTMGTLAEFSQSAQNQTATQEHPTGKTSVCGDKTSQHLEEEIASKPAKQEENSVTHMSTASVQGEAETSEDVATVELQNSTAEAGGMLTTDTSDQRTGSDMNLTPQLQASPERSDENSPRTRGGRLSKVKPKPNLGRASRTTHSKVTELQGTNMDSALVQQSNDHPGQCLTPIEDLPVSKKEENNTTTHQVKKSRFQKVKPKPNLAQTSRSLHPETQTTREAFEKNTNPTPNPVLDEKTTVNIEADEANIKSPAKPSQITGPVSDLTTSLDVVSTLTPTEELSTTEEQKSYVGVVCQAESGTAMSDQSHPEHQSVSEAQFDPSREQANSDPRPTSEPTEGNVSQATESSCSNQLKSDSAVPELEEIPVGHKEEREVASTCQTGRSPNFKTKVSLTQTSRSMRSKPQTTKESIMHNTQPAEKPSSPTSIPESTNNPIAEVEAWSSGNPSQIKSIDTASVLVPSLELDSSHKPTEELTSTGGQKVDVGSAPDSMSEGSGPKIPQRRQRFPKVKPKPNLGSSARNTQTKLSKPSEPCLMDISSDKTSKQQPVVNNGAPTQLQPAEKDGKHLTSELLSSTMLGPTAEKSLDGTNDKGMSSDVISLVTSSVAETQSVLTESVVEIKSKEKHPASRESTGDKVEAGPASQWDHQQDMSVRATETSTQPTDDPTAMSDAHSSEDGSAETHIESTKTQSTADPNESTQQPRSSNNSEAQSQDADQRSETSEDNQVASQSTDDNEPEPTGSSKSSRKTPQIRRGRLVKPKPNLGRNSQPKQVPNQKQAGADSGSHSEGVNAASTSHTSVSEGRPEIQEPVEGAVDQTSPPNDAGSSQGCSTQVPDNSSQHGSTSSTGGIQISTFSNMLLDQAPSDPDEPFFILSLTEIPVSSLGEVEESASDFFPCLPVADASVQQQSCVPVEGLATVGDEPSSGTSTKEIGEAGVINVKDTGLDQAADTGSIVENPVDPHESAAAQQFKLLETDDATEHPPTKKRLKGTARSEAKLQVNPKTQRMKPASKTLSATEVEPIPTQESELPGPSVQPEASDEVITDAQKGSIDHLDIKKTLKSGKDPVDSNSGEETTQTKRASSQKRKPRGVTSSSSSETNNAAPSSECEVAATPSPAQPSEETHPTPSSPTQAEVEQTSEHSLLLFSDLSLSTSLCTAEFSGSQPREGVESSSVEEDSISVSQYFLSDIFTEVEEG